MRVKHYMHDTIPAGYRDHYLIKKWGKFGVARVQNNLKAAEVHVYSVPVNHVDNATLVALTKGHELGHVDYYDDRMFNEPNLDSQTLINSSDDWFMEVDAWLRALDDRGASINAEHGMFILDCLYSYAYLRVDHDKWVSDKYTIAEYGKGAGTVRFLKDYTPEMPPPGQGGKPSVEYVPDLGWSEEGYEGEDDHTKTKEWLNTVDGWEAAKNCDSFDDLKEAVEAKGLPFDKEKLPEVVRVWGKLKEWK